MNLLQCIDLSKEQHTITINPNDVDKYRYRSTYKCAHIFHRQDICFSFQMKKAVTVTMELLVCDVLIGNMLDTSFDVIVNGTKVLASFREHDWSFHRVTCSIPENVIQTGKNNVKVCLSHGSITSLFLKTISLWVEDNGRQDSVMLSFIQDYATYGFTVNDMNNCQYRNDLKSWCLSYQNSYIEMTLNLETARELMLRPEFCSGISGSIINCPVNISVNGSCIANGFYEKYLDFREYSFVIPAKNLKSGENKIRITLDKSAQTCMFVRRIKIGEKDNTITFLTTNDIHGRFLGEGIDFAKLAAYKELLNQNEKNCMLVDSGDPTQGTPFAIYDKGLSTMELMNQVGYDVLTIGNHEFDNISKDPGTKNELSENIKAFKGDFISSNVNMTTGTSKDNYIHTVLPDKNGSWCIRNLNGLNILFIGFTTPVISMGIPRMEGYEIDDIKAAGKNASSLVADIRKHTPVQAVVAVSHLGSKEQNNNYAALAQSFPEADIILDGHSHEIYTDSVRVICDGKEKNIKVIQADCYATHYGIVTMKFCYNTLSDISMEVKKCEVINQMDFSQNQKYQATKAYIDSKQKELNTHFGTVRASALNHTLWGGALAEDKPYPALKAVNIARYVQTNMGVLTAEAMVWNACTYKPEVKSKSEMYIIGGINGGGVRDSIGCGTMVRDYELFSVLPSQLISESSAGYRICEITLSTLKKVLENSVSAIKTGTVTDFDVLQAGGGCFLNTFGIKFTIKKDGKSLAIGDKITLTRQVNGAAAEKHLSFSENGSEKILICMEKYISSGGDGYTIMKDQTVIASDNTALFTTVGAYIQSICSGKEFEYPPVIENITYEGFNFKGETQLSVTVLKDKEPVNNEKLEYCFYNSETGMGEKNTVSTDNNGCFSVTRPKGASVLCVWVKERYAELFMHSYFEVNRKDGVILEI